MEACPDFRQGNSVIWPFSCKHWEGSKVCNLGQECKWREAWVMGQRPEPEWLENQGWREIGK